MFAAKDCFRGILSDRAGSGINNFLLKLSLTESVTSKISPSIRKHAAFASSAMPSLIMPAPVASSGALAAASSPTKVTMGNNLKEIILVPCLLFQPLPC